MDEGFGHLDGGRGRRVEGRTGLQQPDDLSTAVTSTLHDLGNLLFGRPAHLDKVRHRDTGHRRIAHKRHHCVAMAAKNKGGDILDRNLELFSEKIAETGRIQNARHADDAGRRQAGRLLQHTDHDVERIGDADHKGIWAVVADAGANLLHDLGVDANQVVAAHAGLAGDTGGDDDNIAAGKRPIAVRAFDDGVEPLDRACLRDIERLALRDALGNVEKGDVTKLLEAGEERQGASDIAGADERNLFAGH